MRILSRIRLIAPLFAIAIALLAIPLIPPKAHAEAAAAAMAITLPATVVSIISAVALIVVPIVSVPINKVILNLSTWIDNLPAWIKQIVVGIVTTGLTIAAQHVPGVPTSLQGFNVTVVGSLLMTLITFLLHFVQSQSAAPSASVGTTAARPSAKA